MISTTSFPYIVVLNSLLTIQLAIAQTDNFNVVIVYFMQPSVKCMLGTIHMNHKISRVGGGAN